MIDTKTTKEQKYNVVWLTILTVMTIYFLYEKFIGNGNNALGHAIYNFVGLSSIALLYWFLQQRKELIERGLWNK